MPTADAGEIPKYHCDIFKEKADGFYPVLQPEKQDRDGLTINRFDYTSFAYRTISKGKALNSAKLLQLSALLI
jgi:hypothetical protein